MFQPYGMSVYEHLLVASGFTVRRDIGICVNQLDGKLDGLRRAWSKKWEKELNGVLKWTRG
jgi:hypothetical protein